MTLLVYFEHQAEIPHICGLIFLGFHELYPLVFEINPRVLFAMCIQHLASSVLFTMANLGQPLKLISGIACWSHSSVHFK